MSKVTFTECPHCGNTKRGTIIGQCTKCNRFHCNKCVKGVFSNNCPVCGGKGKAVGKIQ